MMIKKKKKQWRRQKMLNQRRKVNAMTGFTLGYRVISVLVV